MIVTIGYAFHDENVNRAIEHALKANKRTRVFVVDPGKEWQVKRDKSTYKQPPFDWMKYGLFDIDWSRFIWLQAPFGPERTTKVLIDAITELCAQ